MQKITNIIKYGIFSLLPLLMLLLLAEVVCRIKYYRMHDDLRYLVEPFIKLGQKGQVNNALDMPEELARKLKENDLRLQDTAPGNNTSTITPESEEVQAITKMMQVSPCKDKMIYSPCFGGEIPRTYNEFCWRGASFNPEKPEGLYRIIAVGGSTVEGHYIADEDLWTRQLEKQLNADHQQENRPEYSKIEVLNAGHHDFYSGIIRKLLDEKAFLFQPDMILYYEAINEQQVSHPLTKIYGKINRLETSVIGSLHKALFFKSFLYTYVLEKYHFSKSEKEYRWFMREEQTREDFSYIIDACRQRGIEFVFVKQVIDFPLKRQGQDLNDESTLRTILEELYGRKTLDPDVWAEIHALNQRLTTILQTNICLEKGALIIDTLPAFDLANRDGEEKLFLDICHKTCYGEKLLADCVYRDLSRLLVLK